MADHEAMQEEVQESIGNLEGFAPYVMEGCADSRPRPSKQAFRKYTP